MRIGSTAQQAYASYEPEFSPAPAPEEGQTIDHHSPSASPDQNSTAEIQGAPDSKRSGLANNAENIRNDSESTLDNQAEKSGTAENSSQQLLDRLNSKDKQKALEIASNLKKLPTEEQSKLLNEALKDKTLPPEMRDYLQVLINKISRGEDINDLLPPSASNEAPRNDAPRTGESDNKRGSVSPGTATPSVGAAGGGSCPSGNASQAGGAGEGARQVPQAQAGGGKAQGATTPSDATQPIEQGTLKPGKGVAEGLMVDSRLEGTLEKIGGSPEGKKLIEAAKAKGLKEIGVSSNLGPNIAGVFMGSSIAIADPNGPNVTSTLAHELGHAAADSPQDSKNEELAVTKVGNRIANSVTNGADSGIPIDVEKGVYAGLPEDNGIIQNLAKIGIRV
jgi:hypothetical protein